MVSPIKHQIWATSRDEVAKKNTKSKEKTSWWFQPMLKNINWSNPGRGENKTYQSCQHLQKDSSPWSCYNVQTLQARSNVTQLRFAKLEKTSFFPSNKISILSPSGLTKKTKTLNSFGPYFILPKEKKGTGSPNQLIAGVPKAGNVNGRMMQDVWKSAKAPETSQQ